MNVICCVTVAFHLVTVCCLCALRQLLKHIVGAHCQLQHCKIVRVCCGGQERKSEVHAAVLPVQCEEILF